MKIHFKLLFLFINFNLFAQQKTDSIILVQPLDEVVLQATKLSELPLRTPLAVSLIMSSRNVLLEPQLSINESLVSVPGLFAQNAYNYNQDLRVSIRGFGARSAFGIRGVKLIVDGIPETTPDGQGQIDNLLVGIIDRIEVIRGPSASLYGNASGGVIYINTLEDIKEKLRLNYTTGSYGLQIAQAFVNLSNKNSKAILALSHSSSDGYRDHSAFNQFQSNYKSVRIINNKNKLLLQVNYTHSPKAYDPGGLTLDQLNENPREARVANLDYDARESIDHFKTGLQLSSLLPRATLKNHLYLAHRKFIGYLPFKNGGVSAFNRFYWGMGSALNRSFKNSNLHFGWSHDSQLDKRKRYHNIDGKKGGLQQEQDEYYSNSALFVHSNISLGNWMVQTGLRADYIALSFDTSQKKQSYFSINPNLGIHYKLNRLSGVYSRYSQSFQTPTLSEISNDPNGSLGFNSDLEPTKANNLEVGFKYLDSDLRFEVALFSIKSKGELVPYGIEQYPGRTFYMNGGETLRKGVEVTFLKQWGVFKLEQSYSYSDFRFKSTNNFLPGIPRHNFFNKLTYRYSKGYQLSLTSVYWGDLYANSSNSTIVKEQFFTHISMSKSFHSTDLKWGVNNLFNSDYYDNIRVNAWGGRYYEPAPTRNVFLGVRWRIE